MLPSAEKIQTRTWHYRIEPNTLTFSDNDLNVDPPEYPPPNSTQLNGSVRDQVKEFTLNIKPELNPSGPIRLIFGSHGAPGLGFHPLGLLLLLWHLFWSSFDSALQTLTWTQRIELLRFRILQFGPQFSGFSSGSNKKAPDLTLDQAKEALDLLPQERLRTLILHTCLLSGVEAISALRAIPHHLACESELKSPPMKIGQWFAVLGNPTADKTTITDECFQNLKVHDPNPTGCFSSHTNQVTDLLGKLNDLGEQLHSLITSESTKVEAIGAITKAISNSLTSTLTVDLGHFCKRLILSDVVTSKDRLKATIEALEKLRLKDPVRTNELPLKYQEFLGISVFLPLKESAAGHSSQDLPKSMKCQAKKWCDFLDEWLP